MRHESKVECIHAPACYCGRKALTKPQPTRKTRPGMARFSCLNLLEAGSAHAIQDPQGESVGGAFVGRVCEVPAHIPAQRLTSARRATTNERGSAMTHTHTVHPATPLAYDGGKALNQPTVASSAPREGAFNVSPVGSRVAPTPYNTRGGESVGGAFRYCRAVEVPDPTPGDALNQRPRTDHSSPGGSAMTHTHTQPAKGPHIIPADAFTAEAWWAIPITYPDRNDVLCWERCARIDFGDIYADITQTGTDILPVMDLDPAMYGATPDDLEGMALDLPHVLAVLARIREEAPQRCRYERVRTHVWRNGLGHKCLSIAVALRGEPGKRVAALELTTDPENAAGAFKRVQFYAHPEALDALSDMFAIEASACRHPSAQGTSAADISPSVSTDGNTGGEEGSITTNDGTAFTQWNPYTKAEAVSILAREGVGA